MSNTSQSRSSRILARVVGIWSELDYAQRRLIEIRTGVTGLTEQRRPRSRIGKPSAR